MNCTHLKIDLCYVLAPLCICIDVQIYTSLENFYLQAPVSLADQNHDIVNKPNLLKFILTDNTHIKVDLLTVVYRYMRATQRFM